VRTEEIRRHRRQVREFHRATGGFMEDRMCCGGVSVPQCHVLLELDDSGPTSLVSLAEALRLDKSTVSRTIDTLVSRGLVDRISNSGDRRYVVLDLTDAGATTVAIIHGMSDEGVRKIFSHIPADRRVEVAECFGLLVDAVRFVAAENETADTDVEVDKSA
jgi:DNA-binding MarR family transcriptional regulator